jgi:hypothetical protein
MRPFSFGHRWLQRGSKYSGPWAQNPWINAASGSLQRRKDLDCALTPAVGIEADSTLEAREEGVQKRQQKVAIGTWEDEGGSVSTHRSMRC